MTSADESDGEGGATTAGRCCVGVSDDELRALQVFFVVNLGTHQVLHAHRVDNQCYALIFNLTVAVLSFLVKRESILESGTTAAGDENPLIIKIHLSTVLLKNHALESLSTDRLSGCDFSASLQAKSLLFQEC